MLDGWRNHRAARRVRAGDGKPLQRFRWWQLLSRSLLTLTLRTSDGTASTYTVDVRQAGDSHDGEVRARLYLDGALLSYSKLPARFSVPGGRIDVGVRTFGLSRCHYVRADGSELQLTPDPASAEGRRARMHRTRPGLSRIIGGISTTFVLIGLCVSVPQLIETISHIPPIADAIGSFDSPIRLPVTTNVLIGIAAVVGSTERALRLRSSWLDDLAS